MKLNYGKGLQLIMRIINDNEYALTDPGEDYECQRG